MELDCPNCRDAAQAGLGMRITALLLGLLAAVLLVFAVYSWAEAVKPCHDFLCINGFYYRMYGLFSLVLGLVVSGFAILAGISSARRRRETVASLDSTE